MKTQDEGSFTQNGSSEQRDVGVDGLGSLAKLLGVFLEPQKTFKAIGQSSDWFIPLTACLLLVLIFNIVAVGRMGIGNILRTSLQGNPQADEIVAAAEGSMFTKLMIYVAPVISIPISLLALAGIFLVVLTLAGEDMNYKKVFSVCAYSLFAYSLGSSFVTLMVIVFTKDFSDFDLRNPLASNVGYFLNPAETGKFLHSLASSLDLLSFWFLFLLGVGFAATSPRPNFRKSLTLVVSLWVVYVIGKAGLSNFFGN